jgi:asparagine synthase (glutamine-hydrolysing)
MEKAAFNFGNDWFRKEKSRVRGTAFLNGIKTTQENLASWSSQILREDLPEKFGSANGFFSALYWDGAEGWMAVDKIRSFPIFYGQKNGQLFISDDAHWVKERVGNTEYDPLAKAEFLLAGYVTGADTLYPNVKQVQAGEIVSFKLDGDGTFCFSPVRYYRYIHKDYFQKTEEELLQIFDQVLLDVFNRLIDFADGRTIVVPLSGGYDSRLIVLMLKRLGYDKLIAFSYGREGNEEARISKEVAESLDIPWEFVPYTNEQWYGWYHSEEMKSYGDMADGCCALPHIQDWPAVKKLKETGRIPKDSVFVPGLSADLPAGSRSKRLPRLYQEQSLNRDLVLDSILEYHYSLFDWSKQRKKLEPVFRERILRTLGNLDDFSESAGAFECWDIAERQVKYINNSIRVYEFFGYAWWTPFWDEQFMAYWNRVLPRYRKKQQAYIKFVVSLGEDMGIKVLGQEAKDFSAIRKKDFLDKVKKSLPVVLKKTIKRAFSQYYSKRLVQKFLRNDVLTVMGSFYVKEIEAFLLDGYQYNGILASYYLSGF